MAEAVQHQLELQIDELDDLYKKGIFNRAEIRQIVKKRREYEYCMRRRQTLKGDFLKYIQYELNVESLRQERKRKLGINKKNSKTEFSIIRRIHFTFQRALQKFKGDSLLWLQYFKFCENTGSTRSLGKAFVTALQYHSLNAGFWIKAAKWEFEEQSNIRAARVLMQRSLRLNPSSELLWQEYFRLELLYWEKNGEAQGNPWYSYDFC